jgi:ABC-2 type transport system permease protein
MSTPSQRSFSPANRLKIGLDKIVRSVLVLAVAGMLNYLGTQFSHQFYLSSQTNVCLSSQTLTILHSLTNQMTVTLYYDTQDQNNFYSTLHALAKTYHAANKNISIRVVDYVNDPGTAAKVKEEYGLPGAPDSPNAPPNKDLVIFAAGDRHEVVPGTAIINYQTVQLTAKDASYVPAEKKMQFRKKPVQFNGELMFTSKLLALARAQPFKAYFLQGHGESSLADNTDNGYVKFALALAQNNIWVNNLELLGDTDVPMDCGLLIIAAPNKALDPAELQKLDKYLAQGGRLLMLFNFASLRQPTGLEPILQKWGVNVAFTYVKDPQSSRDNDQVVIARKFNLKTFVNPLAQQALEMVLPRPIMKVDWAKPPLNPPQVDELVFASDAATVAGDSTLTPHGYPLIAAIEQKPVAGVATPRGNTRIIVAGDSLFLDNQIIETGANRDFLNYAANWLLDRQELLGGISPRSVTEFRLQLTRQEGRQLNWLLLAALPGGILIFGWLVWLVRRK